jgi:ribosomal protein S18 acetylase RimI-like enzyme
MDLVALCAETAADWHSSWLTALGLRSERRGSVWWAVDRPPVIYWTAITLGPDVLPSALSEAHGTVCDAWSCLDLSAFGFEPRDREGSTEHAREPWFMRPAGELARAEPLPDLEIVQVNSPDEVAEFEEVSVRGFGGDDASVAPGTFHPPPILADSRMKMLTGRVEGRPVAAAMGYRTDSAVGIFGVTTIAAARRRGYGTALTRALIDPAVPAILSPSPEGTDLYRRLGFEQVGQLRHWHRP